MKLKFPTIKFPPYLNISISKYFLGIGAIIALSLVLLLWLRPEDKASAGWWNDSWNYRKALTINSNKVVGSHANFPVLVSLTDTSLGAHAQADGDDIVFVNQNGQKLSHEIESFDSSTGVLVAWVKFPTISQNADVPFWMYYGNGGVGSQEEATNVWDENYVMVQHLAEGGTGTRYDSTSFGNDADTVGYDSGSATVNGKINGTDNFDGAADYLRVNDADSIDFGTGDFTASFWIKVPDVAAIAQIMAKVDDPYYIDSGNPGWTVVVRDFGSGGHIRFQVLDSNNNTYDLGWGTTIDDDQWHHVAVIKTNNLTGIYVDGSVDTTYPSVTYSGSVNNGHSFRINDSYNDFDGTLDEVRLSKTRRSADWIQTEYNNQNNPAAFFSAGSEEVGLGPVGYWSFDEGYGTTAQDGSSNNNDGTISGAAWQDDSMCVSGKCLYFDGDNDNVFSPYGQQGSVSERQNASASGNPTASATFGFTPVEGNLLIAVTGMRTGEDYQANTALINGYTVSVGNTTPDGWTKAVENHFKSIGSTGDRRGLAVFYKIATSSSAANVQTRWNVGGGDYTNNLVIHEFENAEFSFDTATADNSGTNAVTSQTSGTTTQSAQANSFIFTAMVTRDESEAASWTNSIGDNTKYFANGITVQTAYGSQANQSTKQSTASWTTSLNATAGILVFSIGSGDESVTRPTNAMTISLWIKPTNISDVDMIIQDFAWNSGSPYGYQLDYNSSLLALRAGNGSADDPAVVAIPWTQNSWQHVAVTWTSAGTANFYRNGIYLGSGTTPASAMSYTGAGGMIMGTEIGNTNDLAGYLDEVKIYPYARTADQIRQDYAAGSAGISAASGVSASFGSRSDKWLTDGLVGYWKMDETAGAWDSDTTADDAVDSSGNGNTGSAYGDADSASGKFGNGGAFDGTGDYLTMANNNTLNPAKITMSAWVYGIGSQGGYATILSKYAPVIPDYAFKLDTSSSGNKFRGYVYIDETHLCAVSDPDTFNSQEWYHVVFTFDGTNCNLYKNGTLLGEPVAQTGSILNDGTEPLLIGAAYPGYDTNNFSGKLDDLRVYNRALSPDEVAALYAWAPGPVARWKFDEGAGTTAYDSAASTTWSGGNHGTLGGATWTSGKYGSGLEFFGGSTHVNAGVMPAIQGSSQITWSFWVKTDDLSVNRTMISRNDSNYGVTSWIIQLARTGLGVGSDDIALFFSDSIAAFTDSNAIRLNSWQHVTYVFDGSQSTNATKVRLYINGTDQTLSFVGTIPNFLDSINRNVLIGAESNTISGSRNSFGGTLDDVQIYNYALTQKQIINVMNGREPSDSAIGSPVGSYALYLPFDEGYGGTAYDKSINKNNGTLNVSGSGRNTVISQMWDKNGKFGSAMDFDGDGDKVDIGNPTSLSLTGSLSISAWFRAEAFTAADAIILSKYGVGANSKSYMLSTTNDNGRRQLMMLLSGDGTSDNGRYAASTLSTNTWYFGVGVYDSEKQTIEMYLNGKKDNGGFLGSIPASLYDSATNVLVGQRDTSYPFNGLIDDVRVYPFVLNDDEVKTLYNSGVAAVMGARTASTTASGLSTPDWSKAKEYCVPGDSSLCRPPVGEWKFDEKTGVTAYDTSGNGNDGSLGGGTAGYRPTWQNGKLGGALKFDGTDDYVTTGNFSVGNTNFTVSAWINSSDLGADRDFIQQPTGSGLRWSMRKSSSNIIKWYDDVGGWMDGSVNISKDRWYFITTTYNGTTLSLYVDGKFEVSNNRSINISGNNVGLNFGYSPGNTYFFGKIDNVRFYNYARTPAQIAWDYNRGGPLAWWRFDECSGGTILDWAPGGDGKAANARPGTISLGVSGVTSQGTCGSSSASFWYNGKDGKRNHAGSFDGTDDYVESNTQIVSAFPFTMSGWVKTTLNSTGNIISFVDKDNTNIMYGIEVEGSTGKAQIFARNTTWTSAYSQTVINNGNWHHVIGVFSSDNDKKLYVDGKYENVIQSSVTYNAAVDRWSVGRLGDSSADSYINGLVDDVKIWNYALTAEQVKTEYAGGAVRFE